jgi:hypothetical protein
MKPRVRFCWECGKKLYGNHFKEIEVDGYKKIVHKTCTDPDAECHDKFDDIIDNLDCIPKEESR